MLKTKTPASTYVYSLFFILLSLASPLISILSFAVYIVIEDKLKEYIFPFSIVIILFLSCLNAVRVPESDTIWYNEYFNEASKYDFIKYIFLRGKEPAFGVFNWIIFQFVGSNLTVYTIVITTFTYGLLIYAVYRFGMANKYSHANILFGIIAVAFIPYIFTQSNHGIRQFVANAILAYIMVERIYYGKKMWWLMAVMFLIHSSSGLFIPLLFLRFFNKKINKKNIICYTGLIIAVLTYRVIGTLLLPMSDSESLGYVASRIAQDKSGGMIISEEMILLNILILSIILYCIHKDKKPQMHENIIRFMHIICVLILYILVNYNQDVISLRFNFYLWVLFPFILMYCFHSFKLNAFYYHMASVAIYAYSFYYLEYLGIWKYDLYMPAYMCPLLFYF